jgi:hypothetical protein
MGDDADAGAGIDGRESGVSHQSRSAQRTNRESDSTVLGIIEVDICIVWTSVLDLLELLGERMLRIMREGDTTTMLGLA